MSKKPLSPCTVIAIATGLYLVGLTGLCFWSYAAQRNQIVHTMLNPEQQAQLLRELAIRKIIEEASLLALAIPLALLCNRARLKAAAELNQLNVQLQQEVDLQNIRELELTDALRDVERFNAVSVGRENRIIELKQEVNELLEQMQQHKRYGANH